MALLALCAAMSQSCLWRRFAWRFAYRPARGHALIAGLSGSAISAAKRLGRINAAEWIKVLWGLLLSTALGFGAGFLCARLTEWLCRNADRRKANKAFGYAQIGGGAATAFMHGAQDGQKFMAIFLLAASLSGGQASTDVFELPLWLMIVCSAVMALGTSIAGTGHQVRGMDSQARAPSGLRGGRAEPSAC